MTRLPLTLLLIGILAIPAVPVNAHDAPNRCGRKHAEGAGWWQNRGHHVGCEKARDLAQRWEDKCVYKSNCPGEPDKIHSIDPGWECTHKKAGYESVRVRCTANEGPAVVHFLWGS